MGITEVSCSALSLDSSHTTWWLCKGHELSPATTLSLGPCSPASCLHVSLLQLSHSRCSQVHTQRLPAGKASAPLKPYSLCFLRPAVVPEVLILPPPLLPPPLWASGSRLSPGSPLQEAQLSLGGQLCVGEPDEEVAGAFPAFIQNAILGQKQLKRARPEPSCSTNAVSMVSHKWQVPTL